MGGRKFPKSWGGARIPGKLNLHVAKTKEKKKDREQQLLQGPDPIRKYLLYYRYGLCVCGGSYSEKEEIKVEKRNETRENLL